MAANSLPFKGVLIETKPPAKHLSQLAADQFFQTQRIEEGLGLAVIKDIEAYLVRHRLPSVKALVGTLETKPST